MIRRLGREAAKPGRSDQGEDSPVTPRSVLIAGGHEPSAIQGSLEFYDTATRAWTSAGNLKTARTGCKIAVDRTHALVIGGSDGSSEVATVEVYNADSKSMSATTYTLAQARNAFTVTKLKDGRFLVVGGMTGAASLDGLDGSPLASAEIFSRQ